MSAVKHSTHFFGQPATTMRQDGTIHKRGFDYVLLTDIVFYEWDKNGEQITLGAINHNVNWYSTLDDPNDSDCEEYHSQEAILDTNIKKHES